jgi:hypothetical protein
VCYYVTVQADVDGSAKGPQGSWFHVDRATVYVDHPVHALAEHTLNIDLANAAAGPAARVGVELTLDSAHSLMAAIQEALDAVAVMEAQMAPQ